MPVTEAQNEDKYAPSTWGGPVGIDLRMPSGQLALVRKPGVQQLIQAGVLHSMDSLSSIVDGLVAKAEGKRQPDLKKIAANPEQIAEMLHIIDRIVCHVVIKPTVVMTPNDKTSRKQGVVYADMVDYEDKLFIVNYATGGPQSVAQFRKESAVDVGDLADVAEDGDQAE